MLVSLELIPAEAINKKYNNTLCPLTVAGIHAGTVLGPPGAHNAGMMPDRHPLA